MGTDHYITLTAHQSQAMPPLPTVSNALQVEHQRVQQLEQAKDDLQFSLEEKVRKVDAAHSKILQDTLAAYDQ